MSRALVVRPEARDDLTEAHDWYESRQAGVGAQFQDAADEAVKRIEANPELYAASRRGARQAPIHRFPYVVIYRLTDDTIEVVAVMHTSRHPRAWRSRL
jgi:plasmid stabilization system protein ParE